MNEQTTLKEIITSRGMSYGQLARKIGVTRQLVSAWVTGACGLSPNRAMQLEAILDIPAIDLLKKFGRPSLIQALSNNENKN